MKNPILYALRCCTVFSFLFSFLVNAQTKKVSPSNKNMTNQNPPGIYVAGNYAVQGHFVGPAYTKNGERIPLTQGEYGLANAIQVVGTDVYVAGDIKEKAVYWKNGQAYYLPCSNRTSTATCIAVVGNDVYIGGNGSDKGDDVYPRYWKNGQEIMLPRHLFRGFEIGTYINNIAVIENDLYIIGRALYEPVYWKNGQKVNAISNDLQRVVAIKEVNGDIYAVGAKDKHAAYWKNGQTKVLSSEESMATAIAIDGNDVYVTGVIGEFFSKNMYPGYGNSGVGYCWINGKIQKLVDDVYPFSIAVSGSDFYITGMDMTYAKYRLLKNGKEIESAVDPQIVVSAGKYNVEKKHNSSSQKTSEILPKNNTGKAKTENSHSNMTNYAKLILGKWDIARKIDVYTDGRQDERGELWQTYIFKTNGNGIYQGNGEEYDFKWHILDNKIFCTYEDEELNELMEIQKLDKSTLVVKGEHPKNSMGLYYWLYTFNRSVK